MKKSLDYITVSLRVVDAARVLTTVRLLSSDNFDRLRGVAMSISAYSNVLSRPGPDAGVLILNIMSTSHQSPKLRSIFGRRRVLIQVYKILTNKYDSGVNLYLEK